MDSDNDRKPPAVPKRKPVPKPPAPSPANWDTLPHSFAATAILAAAVFHWPLRWIVSGAPILFYCILLGDSHGYRVLPFLPLWSVFSSLNLAYAIFSTSWLLYLVFAALCYPSILLVCLFQFDYAAGFVRRTLRRLLRELHFFKDNVAFFDLPALEIDGETNGLFLIRGATLSLSTLTLVAHGIEVGIRLSEDMELAIQVPKVTVSLLRKIEIDDVYANVKGGDWEMTFGTLAPTVNVSDDDDAFIVRDTPILRAATAGLDGTPAPVRPKSTMTGNKPPENVTDAKEVFGSVTQLSPDENTAWEKYSEMLQHIKDTDTVNMAKQALKKRENSSEDEFQLDHDNVNDLRAAICAHIHEQPSIPHPPSKSVRLSTLKKTDYPALKKFLHRLPLLYRLLLNPICYFHPITIKSVTAAGSGKWFNHLMQQYFFKHYTTNDSDVRRLENRISRWLSDANFAVQMADIKSTAQFPVNTIYDIETHFKIADVMAYRTLPNAVDLKQVVRIGGADATITVPTYLFPHHEHIMPAKPTEYDEMKMEQKIAEVKDTPQEVQTQAALEQMRKDEANISISAHAHLPARFHQDLLNFIAALVKATKVIETDKGFEEIRSLRELKRNSINISDPDVKSIASEVSSIASDKTTTTTASTLIPADDLNPEKKSLKGWLRKVDTGFKETGEIMRDGMRKAGLNTASAMANDRWIAKLVGKVVRKLEKAQGDVGYSGKIPVSLEEHRMKGENETKILP